MLKINFQMAEEKLGLQYLELLLVFSALLVGSIVLVFFKNIIKRINWSNTLNRQYHGFQHFKVGISNTCRWIFIAYHIVFFMLFCGPFVGKIFDDFGPTIPLAAGTLMHIFGLMMTSISKKYYQILLSQAVCSGIGASMVFYPAFTCVSIVKWWNFILIRYRFRHGSFIKEVRQLEL